MIALDEKTKTLASVSFYGVLGGLMMIGLPLYLSSLGMSLQQFGLLFGGASLIAGLAKIWLSAWSDKAGRKNITALFGALTALTTASFAFATSLAQFVLIKPVQDFSWSFYLSLKYLRMLDLTSVKERGRQLARFYAAFYFCIALGMLAAGFVLTALGFRNLFLVAGAAALMSVLIAFTYKESARAKRTRVHLSFEVLRKPEARIYGAKNFLDGICGSLVYAFTLPLFFQSQFNFSAEQIGIAMGCFFLVMAVFAYIWRGRVERHGAVRIAALCALLEAAIYLGLSLVSTLPLVLLFLVLDNIIYSLYPVACGKIGSLIPDADDLGRDIMLFDYLFYFGSAAGLFLAGYLAAISFSLVFAARALLMFLNFILLRMLPAYLEGQEIKNRLLFIA